MKYKHLKGEFENTKKEKHILYVALKASRVDMKVQNKEFEMKKTELEKKLIELNDFKKIKVEKERQQKLAKRTEFKKLTHRMKKEKQESSLKEAELSNEHPIVVIKENLNLDIVEPLEPTDCDTLAENVEDIIVDKVEEEF